MKRFITMLAFVLAALANTAHAEFKWEHPGADPYAVSKEEAMRTRESAFQKLGFPAPVVALLMEATKKPGEQVKLAMGERLTTMLSRGGIAHHDVVIAWKSPIRGTEFVAPAEKWQVTFDGKVFTGFLFDVCNNWSAIIGPASTAAVPPPQPLPIIGSCPDVYTLKVNVWTHPALGLPGVERTHAGEELQERFAYVPHVSREHGAQLRKAYAAGQAARSAQPRAFRVSLIMTPEAQGGAPIITKEQVVEDVTIAGLKELQFKRTTLEQWDAIRVVAKDGDVTSPPRYHGTGLHELRFFNHLPDDQHGLTQDVQGEWAKKYNPVADCILNEHWIE